MTKRNTIKQKIHQIWKDKMLEEIDGKLLLSGKGAPVLGEHNEEIEKQFGISSELQPVISSSNHT